MDIIQKIKPQDIKTQAENDAKKIKPKILEKMYRKNAPMAELIGEYNTMNENNKQYDFVIDNNSSMLKFNKYQNDNLITIFLKTMFICIMHQQKDITQLRYHEVSNEPSEKINTIVRPLNDNDIYNLFKNAAKCVIIWSYNTLNYNDEFYKAIEYKSAEIIDIIQKDNKPITIESYFDEIIKTYPPQNPPKTSGIFSFFNTNANTPSNTPIEKMKEKMKNIYDKIETDILNNFEIKKKYIMGGYETLINIPVVKSNNQTPDIYAKDSPIFFLKKNDNKKKIEYYTNLLEMNNPNDEECVKDLLKSRLISGDRFVNIKELIETVQTEVICNLIPVFLLRETSTTKKGGWGFAINSSLTPATITRAPTNPGYGVIFMNPDSGIIQNNKDNSNLLTTYDKKAQRAKFIKDNMDKVIENINKKRLKKFTEGMDDFKKNLFKTVNNPTALLAIQKTYDDMIEVASNNIMAIAGVIGVVALADLLPNSPVRIFTKVYMEMAAFHEAGAPGFFDNAIGIEIIRQITTRAATYVVGSFAVPTIGLNIPTLSIAALTGASIFTGFCIKNYYVESQEHEKILKQIDEQIKAKTEELMKEMELEIKNDLSYYNEIINANENTIPIANVKGQKMQNNLTEVNAKDLYGKLQAKYEAKQKELEDMEKKKSSSDELKTETEKLQTIITKLTDLVITKIQRTLFEQAKEIRNTIIDISTKIIKGEIYVINPSNYDNLPSVINYATMFALLTVVSFVVAKITVDNTNYEELTVQLEVNSDDNSVTTDSFSKPELAPQVVLGKPVNSFQVNATQGTYVTAKEVVAQNAQNAGKYHRKQTKKNKNKQRTRKNRNMQKIKKSRIYKKKHYKSYSIKI